METVALAESRALPAPVAAEPAKSTGSDFQQALKQAGEDADRAASQSGEPQGTPLAKPEAEKPEEVEGGVLELEVMEALPLPLPLTVVEPLPLAATETEPATEPATQAAPIPTSAPHPALASPLMTVAELPAEAPLELPAPEEAAVPEVAPELPKLAVPVETPGATAPTEPAPSAPLGSVAPPAAASVAERPAPLQAPLPVRELPQQLASFVQRLGAEGQTEIHVRLDPPALGQIRVVVEQGKEGIAVRIVAQTPEALLLLQDQRAPLQQELSRQNISMESFSASLGGGEAGGQQPRSQGFSSPSRLALENTVATLEQQSLLVHLPTRIGGLDVRA